MPRMRKRGTYLAAVAQLAEQLFCKHQVFSSILNSGFPLRDGFSCRLWIVPYSVSGIPTFIIRCWWGDFFCITLFVYYTLDTYNDTGSLTAYIP